MSEVPRKMGHIQKFTSEKILTYNGEYNLQWNFTEIWPFSKKACTGKTKGQGRKSTARVSLTEFAD